MRQFFVATVLAAMAMLAASPSSAQTMYDCQSVAKPDARLACDDKLSLPIAQGSTRKPATVTDLDTEDARMRQLLRPICRNC